MGSGVGDGVGEGGGVSEDALLTLHSVYLALGSNLVSAEKNKKNESEQF